MEEKYVLTVIDGDIYDFQDPCIPFLRYRDLTWEDAVTICRLSFVQGFECVLWRVDNGEAEAQEGGNGKCGAEKSS